MAKKNYEWAEGATLDEHSKRKHKILEEYFRHYLITRCKLPQQERFRLAIVDGFAGAGIYKCGRYGSPLIFIDILKKTFEEINLNRATQGMKPIEIECSLVFNDLEADAIEQLKKNAAPLLAEIKQNVQQLHVDVEYYTQEFDQAFPEIKAKVLAGNYRNVLFNLDQCGHSHVSINVIQDIMSSWNSDEVFLTFMISALLTYLSPDQERDRALLKMPKIQKEVFALLEKGDVDSLMNKEAFLGQAEKIVFDTLKGCASSGFVSPFSINNPEGWRYWLIHFANSYRARQVYNNILHDNSTLQAHFGRSGLRMLSYDPNHEGNLYLFDDNSRELAKNDLHDDIPRLISEYGDALTIEDFYTATYNETAAHSDDIHAMIIENPDVEVITPQNGERRSPNTIKPGDVLKLKTQTTMFPIFRKSENNE